MVMVRGGVYNNDGGGGVCDFGDGGTIVNVSDTVVDDDDAYDDLIEDDSFDSC